MTRSAGSTGFVFAQKSSASMISHVGCVKNPTGGDPEK